MAAGGAPCPPPPLPPQGSGIDALVAWAADRAGGQ
eukprot:gene892-53613_t